MTNERFKEMDLTIHREMTKNNVETNKGETEENEEKMGQP
jgi:hypothetical protein